MSWISPLTTGMLVLAVMASATARGVAADDAPSDTFLVVSDFHFDPFDPPTLATTLVGAAVKDWNATFAAVADQPMVQYGADTNYALLTSSLGEIAGTAASVDFAIVPGDFLAHRFQEKATAALGSAAPPETTRDLAAKTTIFVAEALQKALAGTPIFVALGNNDSSCGDYRLDPGGGYLAATKDTVRQLAGGERVAADFDQTYAAGGYYAARHPTLANTLILVVNNVLWSAKYDDACGTGGDAAGKAMFDWLQTRLTRQRAEGGSVWLVHHIPLGIDPFSTIHSPNSQCRQKSVPFMRQPYAASYPKLVADFADVVTASFSGHVHHDSYRLYADAEGRAVVADKIPPAISPIYGQNPSFQIFTYDRATGSPTDFATFYLTNLIDKPTASAGVWGLEYTFSDTFGQSYSPQAVAAAWAAMARAGSARDAFRRYYPVSHGELSAADTTAYVCAIGHLDPQAFTACYCGN